MGSTVIETSINLKKYRFIPDYFIFKCGPQGQAGEKRK